MNPADPVPFIVVATERTGSNLLIGLLESHPDVLVGGELFNPRSMNQGLLAWPVRDDRERDELRDLRERDPVAFLDRIYDDARARGVGAVGFKLMYYHAERHPGVVQRLVEVPGLRVIHLTRRNLFARYVSNEQARITDTWAQASGEKPKALPMVEIEFPRFVHNVLYVETKKQELDEAFADHPTFRVEYEEMSSDPVATGNRVVEFLGLDSARSLAVKYRKTGAKRMRDAVKNYDEIRDRMRRWNEFFDE